MNKDKMTQLKVWVPLEDKINFQVACTKANTNMTEVIGDLILRYLSEIKKEVA